VNPPRLDVAPDTEVADLDDHDTAITFEVPESLRAYLDDPIEPVDTRVDVGPIPGVEVLGGRRVRHRADVDPPSTAPFAEALSGLVTSARERLRTLVERMNESRPAPTDLPRRAPESEPSPTSGVVVDVRDDTDEGLARVEPEAVDLEPDGSLQGPVHVDADAVGLDRAEQEALEVHRRAHLAAAEARAADARAALEQAIRAFEQATEATTPPSSEPGPLVDDAVSESRSLTDHRPVVDPAAASDDDQQIDAGDQPEPPDGATAAISPSARAQAILNTATPASRPSPLPPTVLSVAPPGIDASSPAGRVDLETGGRGPVPARTRRATRPPVVPAPLPGAAVAGKITAVTARFNQESARALDTTRAAARRAGATLRTASGAAASVSSETARRARAAAGAATGRAGQVVRSTAPRVAERGSSTVSTVSAAVQRLRTVTADRRLLVAAFVVVLLVVVARQAGGSAPDQAPATSPTESVPGAVTATSASHSTLLVVADAGIRAELVSLITTDGVGGAGIVFIPVGSMVEVPSFGLEEIAAAHEVGGTPLVRSAVENVFGVQIDDLITLTPDTLARVFDNPLFVDVPERVEQLSARGRVEVLWPAGPAAIDGNEVVDYLTLAGDRTELATFPRQQSLWSGWIDALDSATWTPPSTTSDDVSRLVDLVGNLAGFEVTFDTLPVESIGPGSIEGTELYRVHRGATAVLAERLLPDGPSADAPRARVQLLNGTGAPGLAREVTAALVPAGAEVLIVDNADRFDYDTTQVVYYDDDQRPAAQAMLDALGVGELVRSRTGLTVVDVTVVVGADFASR